MSRWMPRWSGLDRGQRARQGSLGCIQRPDAAVVAAAVAGSSSTDRWEAESSSTARCQLSITLVLGIEHGEAEREAASRRPDYIQLASQGDARPWPLVLPLLRIQAGWQNVLVLVLVPVCWRWCLGCTKHPRVTQSRCRPFAQSVPVEAEALAQRRGKQASKAL